MTGAAPDLRRDAVVLAKRGDAGFAPARRLAKCGNRRGGIMADRVLEVSHRRDTAIFFAKPREPLFGGRGREFFGERTLHLRLPSLAGILIGDEIFATQLAAEIRPELRLQRADGQVRSASGGVNLIAGVRSEERRVGKE